TREHLRASPARARTRRYQVPGHGGKDLGPPRPPAESRTTTTLRPSAGYRLISSVPLSRAPTISRIPFNFLRPLILLLIFRKHKLYQILMFLGTHRIFGP